MIDEIHLTDRQLKMLTALSARSCATMGPADLIDEDYAVLFRSGFVREYWGSGVMCTITDKGRRRLGLSPVEKDGSLRSAPPETAPR